MVQGDHGRDAALAHAAQKIAVALEGILVAEQVTGGLEMVLETQMGKIPMSTAFVEYKDFNGLRFPVRSEAKQAGQKIVTLYQAITLDSVDAAVFELPKEIKALLEPEPAEEEDAGASSPAPAAKP